MVTSCSAVGCKERATKGNRITFHRFPANPELRGKWIKAVKRKNFEPTKNSRLCEKHFTLESYVNFAERRKLKEDAVPVIFDFSEFLEENPKIQQSARVEPIHCIQFINANSLKDNPIPNCGSNRTVIVIDDVVRARRVEKESSCNNNTENQNFNLALLPVIGSSFSLSTSPSKNSETTRPTVPCILNFSAGDCTQKRLFNKTKELKRKYKERLKIMNHVSKQLKKRKTFLENLLIRIKEKQLTSDEDVTDLMDCFMEEEDEELSDSDEDSLVDVNDCSKTIASVDYEISKLKKSVGKQNNSSEEPGECEAFALHIESEMKKMPKGNTVIVKNQIEDVLKKYREKRLLKLYKEFNETFYGLENIETND